MKFCIKQILWAHLWSDASGMNLENYVCALIFCLNCISNYFQSSANSKDVF